MPWVLWSTKNRLSNCHSLLEVWNASPLGHQSQTVKRYFLCGLCTPVGFSKTAVLETAQSHQLQKASVKVPCLHACVHFRLGAEESHNHSDFTAPARGRECHKCPCSPASADAMTAHAHPSQQGGGRVCIRSCLPVPACYVETAAIASALPPSLESISTIP